MYNSLNAHHLLNHFIYFKDSPGCSPKGGGESVEHTTHEHVGILTRDHKIDDRKGDKAVDEQATDHAQHIHGELVTHQPQVLHLHNLSSN